jgi:hypothetical protein
VTSAINKCTANSSGADGAEQAANLRYRDIKTIFIVSLPRMDRNQRNRRMNRQALHGVNMFRKKRISTGRAIRYATVANFFEIYNEEMHSLLLLSILLTADREKAEQCFVGGLEECLHGIDVFMEWARLWARRAIIKHAIKLVKPVPEQPKRQSLTSVQWNSTSTNHNFIGAIFALGTFERFVFVVSLLERQSDEDCAALLSCKRRDVESARAQALKKLSDINSACSPFNEALEAWGIIQARQNARPNTCGKKGDTRAYDR